MKEQRDRDDRERLEEIESYKKENKDLKEKVNALQAELTEKEVSLFLKTLLFYLCHYDERKCIGLLLSRVKYWNSATSVFSFRIAVFLSILHSPHLYIKYCFSFYIAVHRYLFVLYLSFHWAQIFNCCSCFCLSVREIVFSVFVPPEYDMSSSVLWMFVFHCMPAPVVPVVCTKWCLLLSMLIFESVLFGGGGTGSEWLLSWQWVSPGD